jgi:hypothetical protein
MPGWLIRYMPHALIVLAVLAGVWWIHSSGYDAAMRDRDVRDAQMAKHIDEKVQGAVENMTAQISNIEMQTVTKLERTHEVQRTIVQPQIQKEIVRETRFTDPAAGLSDGLCEAINRARSESHSAPGSTAVACVTLSPASPAAGSNDSNAGE